MYGAWTALSAGVVRKDVGAKHRREDVFARTHPWWHAWEMTRAFVVLLLACGGTQREPLAKAGDSKDDGAGELAQASLRLMTPADDRAGLGADTRAKRREAADDAADATPYGGDAYGGSSYASWRVPQWTYTAPSRMPRYNISLGLTGAVEGAVTWNGPPPPKVSSSCGPIDNPTLRVGNDKGVRGVIVYIEKIAMGRNTPYYSKPAQIGGVLVKRGCSLVPAAQIVTPLPASVAIHGDTQRAKLRVANRTYDLEEAGLVQVEVKAGATKVDSEDGKVAAAWVLGLETPYYAITDDDGRFRIDELATGTYELTIWQPPIASANRDGTWAYGAPIILKRTVKIDGKTPAHVVVALPVR